MKCYRITLFQSVTSIMSCFLAFGYSVSVVNTIQAREAQTQIDVLNSWVEDGYIFHIDFEVLPYHMSCHTRGAAYIGFNIYYKDTRSLKEAWTFGLASWPDGPGSDFKIESHLTAYGPQAFCSRFSPCLIQEVQMVKKWCPIP